MSRLDQIIVLIQQFKHYIDLYVIILFGAWREGYSVHWT
jgi:hypothetical protein